MERCQSELPIGGRVYFMRRRSVFAVLFAGITLAGVQPALASSTPASPTTETSATSRVLVLVAAGASPATVAASVGVDPYRILTGAVPGFAAVMDQATETSLSKNPTVVMTTVDAAVTSQAIGPTIFAQVPPQPWMTLHPSIRQ